MLLSAELREVIARLVEAMSAQALVSLLPVLDSANLVCPALE